MEGGPDGVTALERALVYANGTHTVADIEAGVADGRFQKWENGGSVVITEILDSPRVRTLHFFLAGGSLEELRPMLEPIIEWGRREGCTRASLIGRLGWMRSFMRGAGFKPTALVMEKEL